ncbi:MAG TPA: DUF308 domain-containing protein [Gemmatimonadales bacterium]|nr:DUF308 domain-containing protein [Gemmatimonadales bacterium]
MIAEHLASAARHHWWLFLLRGIFAIVFGVLVLLWPAATVLLLMAFIAAYALVDGGVTLAYAFRLRASFDRWWVLLIQGLISVAFGVLAFIHPALSLFYIVVSVSLWMFFASLALFMLARAQNAMGASSGWSVLGGILSLALAVAAVVYPWVTIAAVLGLIAWFALFVGMVQIVVAFRMRSFAAGPTPA